ncbi:MAG: guanylate kinase [Legionellales bacterium RIFCSPHIGHO2_12_FULL_35_11]|nr:MAG: guanylate kinase [Legionellales bacterium RIFCSPHIGHO2_12_FULL_35_11]
MQTENLNKQDFGTLYIVAAPSGGGKTSLVKELVSNLDKIETSVSHTTRGKRPAEMEGVHYYFISEQEFSKMVKNNEFVEYAQVFDNFYGTSFAEINARLADGIDVVLDIDWQGSQQIKKLYPSSVSVFVIPPSLEALQNRLITRAQDTPETIDSRMLRAKNEMGHFAEFDYLIVNDNFAKACDDLTAIVKAERLKISRQIIRRGKLLSLLLP